MASIQPYIGEEASLSSSTSSASPQNRDSNMVRASVLDAALQLGIGGPNSTVANWIFNNPLDEEEEPEETPIPELASSTATSEESHSNGHAYPYTPLSAGAPPNPFYSHNNGAAVPYQYQRTISSSKDQNQTSASASTTTSMEQQSDITPSPSPLPIPFPTIAPSISASSVLKQSSGTKLRRKVKKSGSGYESDGYVSDVGKSAKEKEKARKVTEAKAAKEAEKEAKAAKKEAKKEEKVKKSKSKKEKKDKGKSKTPISGDATEYETDAASDGAYLSEAVSFSSVSSKKSKASSKSRADDGSDSVKKKTGSFFRRKSKPTPVVPPMPASPFPLSASTSSSTPLSSLSVSTPGPRSASVSKAPLPPIAARFATTSATPSISASTLSPSESSLSPNPSSLNPSSLPSLSPSSGPKPSSTASTAVTSTPSPIPSNNRDPDTLADEGDDVQSTTTSSHSSEISTPASLPTSTSSHRKPSRPGLFKFGGGSENMKAKPTISLPLTRPVGAASPMSSRGVSPMSGTPSSTPVNGSGLELRGVKPMLEGRMQESAKSALSREVSPAPSLGVAAPTIPATHLPSLLTQSSTGRTPIAAPAPTANKSRPTLLKIQHPHEYNGLHTQDLPLPSPRRPNHLPVPPPTPPPTGPLPRVPPLTTNSKSGVKGPASAPPLLAPPHFPAPGRTPSPIQRGKEVPFPNVKRDAGPARLDGFEARMDVPRYRGLYGFGGGNGNSDSAAIGRQQHVSAFSADSDADEEEEDEDYLDPEMLTKEFQQIRQRFYDHDRERASVPITEPDRYNDSLATGGDDSFLYQQLNSMSFSADPEPGDGQDKDEAERKYSDDRSMYPQDDKSAGYGIMYELEGRDSKDYDDGTRISRFSASQSIYSVMDDEKSGEARERFLSRVAAMYGEGGREVPPMPPIPKMPEELIIKGTGVGRRRRTVIHE